MAVQGIGGGVASSRLAVPRWMAVPGSVSGEQSAVMAYQWQFWAVNGSYGLSMAVEAVMSVMSGSSGGTAMVTCVGGGKRWRCF